MTKTPIKSRSEAACKTVLKNLERRGFEAYYCEDKAAALAKALELIPAEDVVSWGGSVSIQEIGLLEVMRSGRYKIIDRETAETPEQRTDLLRQALLCDTFLMSSNAISEDGQLVNIDGTGNRVAAMVYGPKSAAHRAVSFLFYRRFCGRGMPSTSAMPTASATAILKVEMPFASARALLP